MQRVTHGNSAQEAIDRCANPCEHPMRPLESCIERVQVLNARAVGVLTTLDELAGRLIGSAQDGCHEQVTAAPPPMIPEMMQLRDSIDRLDECIQRIADRAHELCGI